MKEKIKSKGSNKTKSKRNGEGTIFYSESKKKWIAQYTAGIKPNGKLNRPTISGKTYAEVSSKLKKVLRELDTKQYLSKDKATLKDIIPLAIEDEFAANGISESTYFRKKETAEIIYKMPIANIPIQKLTEININSALINIKHYSDSQIEKIYGILHQAYNKCVLLKILNNDTNFFNTKGAIIKPKSTQIKDIDAIISKEEEKAFSIDEQKLFLDQLINSSDPYKKTMLISIFTGMRIGEVLALRVKNIDFINNKIYIRNTLTKGKDGKIKLGYTTKTYSGSRDIPLPPNLVEVFESIIFNYRKNYKVTYPSYFDSTIKLQYNDQDNNLDKYSKSIVNSKKAEDFLFLYNTKFISPNIINSHFKRICKDAGIRVIQTEVKRKKKSGEKFVNLKSSDVYTHMLRHTYATRCIEAGMPAVVLQRLLGHKDVTITLNTYTHVFNKFKEKELDKVNEYLRQANLI